TPPCSLFFSTLQATPAIYTLSLHDALPISRQFPSDFFGSQHRITRAYARCALPENIHRGNAVVTLKTRGSKNPATRGKRRERHRSEEHTSELQSRENLVCRLLLEKKK